MFKSPVSKIISKDNRTYRECLKLLDKKHRDREGLYLVEGEKLVREALQNSEVELVLISDKSDKKAPAAAHAIEIKDSLFKNLADTVTSQGIIAVVKKN